MITIKTKLIDPMQSSQPERTTRTQGLTSIARALATMSSAF